MLAVNGRCCSGIDKNNVGNWNDCLVIHREEMCNVLDKWESGESLATREYIPSRTEGFVLDIVKGSSTDANPTQSDSRQTISMGIG